MKDKQLAEALRAYFEGRENEAEKTLENPAVFLALVLVNAMKNNHLKAEMFVEKMRPLYDRDKEAGNQALAEVKPLLEFYAEKQVPSAQYFLGVMFDAGFGVKQDDAEAVKWYRKSAEQGHAGAQFNLGLIYENGDGVKQNYKTAYMWYFLAGLSGDSDASYRVLELETDGWFSSAKVSPSEANEAKLEARRKYNEIKKRYGLN